jgi:hypothetical protein
LSTTSLTLPPMVESTPGPRWQRKPVPAGVPIEDGAPSTSGPARSGV